VNPSSLPFLVFFIVALLIFSSLSRPVHRRYFLSAVNLGFLVALIPNWQSWASLVAFIFGSYGVLLLARRKVPTWLVVLSAAAFVVGFLFLKKYVFLVFLVPASLLDHAVELIGISYMLFKFLHMAVDLRQQQPLSLTLFGYVNYQLAFFTLIAGPIQRFNDFQKFWETMAPDNGDLRETLSAWNRILNGILKMGLLAVAAQYLYEWAAGGLFQPQSTQALLGRFAIYFYAYPVYLYFNFSGYTDIVLGCAKLFGLRLPENFDRPYLARNVVDFWNRWHITLTTWVRDYVFMTSYKWVVERFRWLAKGAGYALTFSALLIVGIWHGSTLNFVVFGLLHGIGAMATQMYGALLKSRLKQSGLKRYNQNQWIRGVAMATTFHFVCVSFLFFPADLQLTLDRLQIVADRLR